MDYLNKGGPIGGVKSFLEEQYQKVLENNLVSNKETLNFVFYSHQ